MVSHHTYSEEGVSFHIQYEGNRSDESWLLKLDVRRFLNLKETQTLSACKYICNTLKCSISPALHIVKYINKTLI